MKTLSFECYVQNFEGWEEDIDLTVEEYNRITLAIKDGYHEFIKCDQLSDIYNRVYKIVVDIATDNFLEFLPEVVEEYTKDNENWKADDTYYVGINFPRDLINELSE